MFNLTPPLWSENQTSLVCFDFLPQAASPGSNKSRGSPAANKKSDIETKEAINREKARRANEIVERMLESDSPAKTRERSY